MKNIVTHLIVCCMAMALMATEVMAQSIELRLADGTRWRGAVGDQVEIRITQRGVESTLTGKIIANANLHLTLQVETAGETRDRTVFKSDIVAIKTVQGPAPSTPRRGDTTTTPRTGEPSRPTDSTRPQAAKEEGPGVFVLPLSGTVGTGIRHQEIEAMAAEADKYGPGQIIILLLNTPGGLVIEMEEIARVLTEIKKRHRLIAWIQEAISAGAATAAFCDEIYFTTQGVLGSMTMVRGTTGVDEPLQMRWAQRAGEWFRIGGRSPYIGQAMVMQGFSLSYDKDPETGRVTWYDSLAGEFILSRPGQNLTFNASNALHSGFSSGTADTTDELAALLNMPEWREVSDFGRRLHADWQRTVQRAEEEIPRLIARLNYWKTGGGNPIEVLGARIQIMEQLAQWVRRTPRLAMMNGLPEIEVFEREIAELRKQLADMRREERRPRPNR